MGRVEPVPGVRARGRRTVAALCRGGGGRRLAIARPEAAATQLSNGNINRMMWKAEGWLMGYNGGPIRHPTSPVLTTANIA